MLIPNVTANPDCLISDSFFFGSTSTRDWANACACSFEDSRIALHAILKIYIGHRSNPDVEFDVCFESPPPSWHSHPATCFTLELFPTSEDTKSPSTPISLPLPLYPHHISLRLISKNKQNLFTQIRYAGFPPPSPNSSHVVKKTEQDHLRRARKGDSGRTHGPVQDSGGDDRDLRKQRKFIAPSNLFALHDIRQKKEHRMN